MRAFSLRGEMLQLGLADVEAALVPTVERLGFEPEDGAFVRRFPRDAPFAERAAERFERCAEELVRQAADLVPVPWEETLELLVERIGLSGWTLVGSAVRALRGEAAVPHDLDLVSGSESAEFAAAFADLLVEPLAVGGWIGERWWRAFGPARIEGVGGFSGTVVDLGTTSWRGHELRLGRIA